jgi:catechol 2,3-dioxygenase-like lactoylglutathione lyase family enzyme
MSKGLSHITLITTDLDRMQQVLEVVLEAKIVYDSGAEQFSHSEERFFLVGDVWVATMKGGALPSRSYNHIAFQIEDDAVAQKLAQIEALGLDLRPPRPRVEGEGQSIYFYGPDNHLFELHTGTLEQRLARYAEGRRAGA